jgi:outer membrane protein assembly factor BamD (BamD/ComL family)
VSKLLSCAILLGVVVSLGIGTGCRKNAAERQVDATLKQPIAVEILTAIDKQEYDKAIPAWMNARMAATNEQQRIQIAIITQQAKLKLYDLAATNAKAAEALSTIRMMSGGGR